MKHLMFFLTTCIVLLFGSCATEKELEKCADSIESFDTDALIFESENVVLTYKYKLQLANPMLLEKLNSIVVAGCYSDVVPVYRVSEEGKAFIKKNEGCRLKPYWDCKGWSAGYGHFMGGSKSHRPKNISKKQADIWFEEDIKKIEKEINDFLTLEVNTRGYVVPQCFIDGLADFMYNCGVKRIDGMEFKKRVKEYTRWHDPYNVESDLYFCAKFLRGRIVRAKVTLDNGKEVYKVLPQLKERRDKEADLMQKQFLYLVREQNR